MLIFLKWALLWKFCPNNIDDNSLFDKSEQQDAAGELATRKIKMTQWRRLVSSHPAQLAPRTWSH